MVKNPPVNAGDVTGGFDPWVEKRRAWQHTSVILGCLGGASGKEPTCQCKRLKRRRFNPWVEKIPWRRTWQPTSVILPGELHGQRSLVGYSPWGHKEPDMTEETWHTNIKDCFPPTAKKSRGRQWLALVQPLGVTLRVPGPTRPLPSLYPGLFYFRVAAQLLQHQPSCLSSKHEGGGSDVSIQLCFSFITIGFPRSSPFFHHRPCIGQHCGTWSPPGGRGSGE